MTTNSTYTAGDFNYTINDFTYDNKSILYNEQALADILNSMKQAEDIPDADFEMFNKETMPGGSVITVTIKGKSELWMAHNIADVKIIISYIADDGSACIETYLDVKEDAEEEMKDALRTAAKNYYGRLINPLPVVPDFKLEQYSQPMLPYGDNTTAGTPYMIDNSPNITWTSTNIV
jgi:hypothetical protein